tara:strand:- start:1156 stop:1734 length:579 start_codon:yes stop_codon:yes gene_type:complete
MSSEIKVDTISEKTSAGGVTIDGLKIKDVSSGSVMSKPILQVVEATDVTDTSYTGTGPTALGSLNLSITPTSTSSKILLMATVNLSSDSTRYWTLQFYRDTTELGVSDQGTGSQTNAFIQPNVLQATDVKYQTLVTSMNYVDSPSSTSAITYSVKIERYASSTVWYNRPHTVADAGYSVFTRSTIQALEIAG